VFFALFVPSQSHGKLSLHVQFKNDNPSGNVVKYQPTSVLNSFMCDRSRTVGNLLPFVGLLASSQYPEGPALTGHLGTGFPWFPFV
jgi:hypothetical protein